MWEFRETRKYWTMTRDITLAQDLWLVATR